MTTPRRYDILVVSPCFPPAHGGGGLRILRTYQRVSKILPINVTVITEAGRHYRPGWNSYEGWPVYAIQPTRPARALARAMFDVFAASLRPVAAIHLIGLDVLTKWVGLLGYLARVPIMAELTVDIDAYRPSLRGKLALVPLRHASLAIALTPRIAEWMNRMGVPAQRVWQRPNPVDTTRFRFPTEAERKAARFALGLPANQSVHLVFGRFCPRKNQQLAIHALARLPTNHRLVLAGPVFDEDKTYFDAICHAISEYRLQEKVMLVARNVDDAASLYFAVDQLWLPSTREGLPNVMLEALCCGVPVLANAALGLSDYVVNGKNGAIVCADPSSFAEAAQSLQTLSADHSARRIISQFAGECYDAEEHCYALAGRLENILHRHGNNASIHREAA